MSRGDVQGRKYPHHHQRVGSSFPLENTISVSACVGVTGGCEVVTGRYSEATLCSTSGTHWRRR